MEIHTEYTRNQAIEGFQANRRLDGEFCDGEFVLLQDIILCFFTIEYVVNNPKNDDKNRLDSPTYFIWHPKRMDYAPNERWTWFPYKAREIYNEERTKKEKTHHLFLRNQADEKYLYAGEAHLGSYGGWGEKCDARFTLKNKLPRENWDKFGGYKAWCIDTNHQIYFMDKSEVNSFDNLFNKLQKQESFHFSITRYEEDSLHLHTNNKRSWLMYLREPGDCGLYIEDQKITGKDKIELFECSCSISMEFPKSQTVTRKQGIEIVRDFYLNGELSSEHVWIER